MYDLPLLPLTCTCTLMPKQVGCQIVQEFFDPDSCPDAGSSLAISMGRGGARLSHGHQKQYTYVLQSLTLCEPQC
jgi:Protein of unknown function (DUF2009)